MSTFVTKKTTNQAEVLDLVNWFLLKNTMTQKKIQKLVYYSQAWSLVFLNEDIVEGITFQAWVHGPVNMTIRMEFMEYGWNFIELKDPKRVEKDLEGKFLENQLHVLEQVWKVYGQFTADQLENLVHNELPWLEQRIGLDRLEASKNVISNETMKSFYKKMIIE